MRSFIRKANHLSRRAGVAVTGAALALATAPAFAQTETPAGVDYAGMINGGKTELTTALTAIGPAVFGIMAILAAVGLAWKFFKRGAKSS